MYDDAAAATEKIIWLLSLFVVAACYSYLLLLALFSQHAEISSIIYVLAHVHKPFSFFFYRKYPLFKMHRNLIFYYANKIVSTWNRRCSSRTHEPYMHRAFRCAGLSLARSLHCCTFFFDCERTVVCCRSCLHCTFLNKNFLLIPFFARAVCVCVYSRLFCSVAVVCSFFLARFCHTWFFIFATHNFFRSYVPSAAAFITFIYRVCAFNAVLFFSK